MSTNSASWWSLSLSLSVSLLLVAEIGACKSSSSNRAIQDGGLRDSARGDGLQARSDVRPTDGFTKPACAADAGPPSKGKSEPCACNGECRSGFCVDGVCCTSACGESCKACNLPNSLGDCSFIPAGASPADPSVCKASTPASCGRDGTCDGKGGCRLYVADTLCDNGSCDGDGLSGMRTCDGKGACSGSLSKPCGPYSCDVTSNTCDGNCTTNAECAAGQQCALRSCGMKLNGFQCAVDGDCASGHCSNGTCCNVACDGPCVSCAQTGWVGRCRFISAGLLAQDCPAEGAAVCGSTGRCDGAGSCAVYPETTPCAPSSCAGPTLLRTAAACDGKGTCQQPQLVDCSPFRCVAGACTSSCLTDADCEPGHACVLSSIAGVSTGTCGKRKNGQVCSDASDCESAQCVDGVCCESACQGACRSCALPGSPGQCVEIPAGAPDPRKTCTDDGTASCGHDGLCDGKGACQLYAVGTACGSASCKQGASTAASICNQAGQCVAPPSQTCSPYVCNGPTCFTSCTRDADCVAGRFCVAGSCGKKPDGAECSGAGECESGFCAQGICCNSGCTGACEACNLTATLGLCTAVSDGVPDPQGKCKATAQTTCGTTGTCLAGACAYVAKDVPCKPAACATTSSMTPAFTCDGHGTCTTPVDVPCGSFVCSGAACLSTCSRDSDCVPPNSCVGNSCGLKSNGVACTVGRECGSGVCSEGVCCNSACSDASAGGLCMSCKVAGKVGTCSPVQDGQRDPKQRCVASNADAGDCSNSGTCNGKGACKPWPTSTGCRQASCSGTAFYPAVNCDGAGNCPPAGASACDPYKCSTTSPSCLTTCTSDVDCVTGETCLKTTNRCGDKLANGQSCKANSDCSSNICSAEGVCCNTACTGGCQSCVLASKVGTCSNIATSGAPRDKTTCASTSTCGNTGKCNGAGGCQLTAAGTVCGAAACAPAVTGTIDGSPASESLAQIPAPVCDGSGNCQSSSPISCGAYQCNASTAQCKSTCASTTADCNALTPSTANPSGGNRCIGNSCQKQANGTACTADYLCASGNCVDGVCCGTPSCGACMACNLANTSGKVDGLCRTVAAGTPEPHGLCSATASSSCGTDGKCTAAGACEKWSGSSCTPDQSKCVDSRHSVSATGTCNGSGTCTPGPSVACGAGYLCSGGQCASSCTSDAACDTAAGYGCFGKKCLKSAGQACAAGAECGTGNCVDGVCCASASCGACMACNLPSPQSTVDGTCRAVGAGKADPHGLCATTASTTCSTDGKCDGAGACELWSGTACTPNQNTCADATHQMSSSGTCNGSGVCAASSPVACKTGYACVAGTCATACTADTSCDVTGGYGCFAGVCLKQNGQSCSAAADCGTGNCVSSGGTAKVCCAAACTDKACGTKALCLASGSGCQTHQGDTCGSSTCSTDARSSIGAGTCDGIGACVSPTAVACATGYLCRNGTCASSCATSSDCDVGNGYQCVGTTCQKQSSNGQACTNDSDCSNGHCLSTGGTGKVCCAVACTNSSCGNKAQCMADGSGCQTHAGEACGTSGCSTDRRTAISSTCDGVGGCVPTTSPCTTGYLCSGSACATSCTSDTSCDTAGGYLCDTSTRTCRATISADGGISIGL